MTWRGDGGSEGLRTIVPPIVDSACVFRDGRCERSANTRKPEVQSLIWYAKNCAKSEQMHLDMCHGLSSANKLFDSRYMAIATAQVESRWRERRKGGRCALTATGYVCIGERQNSTLHAGHFTDHWT